MYDNTKNTEGNEQTSLAEAQKRLAEAEAGITAAYKTLEDAETARQHAQEQAELLVKATLMAVDANPYIAPEHKEALHQIFPISEKKSEPLGT